MLMVCNQFTFFKTFSIKGQFTPCIISLITYLLPWAHKNRVIFSLADEYSPYEAQRLWRIVIPVLIHWPHQPFASTSACFLPGTTRLVITRSVFTHVKGQKQKLRLTTVLLKTISNPNGTSGIVGSLIVTHYLQNMAKLVKVI